MKIAIIGAGGAGLCSGRHCLAQNIPFEIFEQTGNVGGTWNYTDQIGHDENGIPIHTSMYKGLRSVLHILKNYKGHTYLLTEQTCRKNSWRLRISRIQNKTDLIYDNKKF